jgi:hypothetical protein
MSCTCPAIALSGVRSSWLMFARNWLFVRLASSASARAARSASTSRAFASAAPARRATSIAIATSDSPKRRPESADTSDSTAIARPSGP